MDQAENFDVLAVNLETKRVRVIDTNKTKAGATAIAQMAVIRRGCNEEIFVIADHGSHVEGETWKGATYPALQDNR